MRSIVRILAASSFGLLLHPTPPAAAVGNGQCCARVGNTCISTCKKALCSGEGDCSLLKVPPHRVEKATDEELDLALATLSDRDARRLWKLTGKKEPIPCCRPGYEPIQGVTSVPNSQPQLVQTGGTTAKVPMKHGSCGLDCGTHVLASASGNLDAPFRLSLACPPGQNVVFLAYQLAGASQVAVVAAPSGKSSVAEQLELRPFSKAELENACKVAFGGPWTLPDRHHNAKKTAAAELEEPISYWGRCSGSPRVVEKSLDARLEISCIDESWSPPPGS